ncbi:MAG: hypothetical protein PWP67_3064 [Clostridium butyricum]|nr:hypothetical protein [Petroclostridium sp.]MDK2830228.1 hypothetical protein [Clostridium butyricum]
MKNSYSFSEYMKNVYSYLMTKLTIKKARFIRRPIYIRGKKSISGCASMTTGRFCRFDLEGNKITLIIGKNCELGDMTHIVAHNHVQIGDNVLIASKCFISDTNHGSYVGEKQDSPCSKPSLRELVSGKTVIGNNVWIGENAVILSGAEIGDGCVIGANSVVSKKFKAGSMIVGVNTVIKVWNEETKKWERTG